MRTNPLFLRNEFEGVGKWGIPLVKKQLIDLSDVSLIAYSETRSNETETRRRRGGHFFIDDYRFGGFTVTLKSRWKSFLSTRLF